MWEKVVSNLLSNAFKFTFDGEVTVTLTPEDGAVELHVGDSGVGIPEDQRTRVFERFHRIEGTQARTYEGTGIGLALVQELIKLHGGHVRVESTVGQGSTFIVTIPLGRAHLPAERIQAARSMAPTENRSRTRGTPGQASTPTPRRPSGWLPDDWSTADVTMLPALGSRVAPCARTGPTTRELIVVADDNADMRHYLKHLLGGSLSGARGCGWRGRRSTPRDGCGPAWCWLT